MSTYPSKSVARMRTGASDRPWRTSSAVRALEAAGLCAVVEVDAARRIVELSASAATLLGVDPHEALGQRLGEAGTIIAEGPDTGVATLDEFVRSILETGLPRAREVFRIRRPDGRTRWLQIGAAPVGEEGADRGVVCMLADVTSLARTRDALAAERKGVARAAARFRAVMDGMADAMLVHSDGRGGFANRAFLDLVGASSVQEIVGKELATFLPGHASGGGVALRQERWTAATGRALVVELTERSIDIEGAPATMVLAHDVTDRLATQAKLMHSDRLATLGTLVAGIVHEINNPLGSVLANVQCARELAEEGPRAGGPSAEIVDALRDAEKGIDLVANIARDLKSFGRDDGGALAQVDLRGVVRAALTLTKANLHASAELSVSLPERPLLVTANESRLAQVFINLLLNATQAMDRLPRKERRVGVVVRAEAEHAVVEVSDTGQGMGAETLERLFEPFFTTKAPGVGTGLGLWMCRNIVQTHGGKMVVESVVGRGSTFRVLLPRTT